MAQRLATEYVKTCLEVTEAEMNRLIQLFMEQETRLQIKVLDNGSQEFVFLDDADEEIVLSFERKQGKYVCTGTCRLRNPKLANAMRKAISDFKGNAQVNRHYAGFTMVYHYERGTVTKIIEVKNGVHNVIYTFKDTVGQLERLFLKDEVEREITRIQTEVDRLLDLRIGLSPSQSGDIDRQLTGLTKRMFELEA